MEFKNGITFDRRIYEFIGNRTGADNTPVLNEMRNPR